MARIQAKQHGVNLCAFLDMIAHSEGTSGVIGSDDGYNVLVSGQLFQDYSKHPLENGIWMAGLHDYSTAAGRYQLLHRYFRPYAQLLNLRDFSPESQDLIAIQQIRECGAQMLIGSDEIANAIDHCKRIWASLPGAGYGQRENSLASLQSVYRVRQNLYISA